MMKMKNTIIAILFDEKCENRRSIGAHACAHLCMFKLNLQMQTIATTFTVDHRM